MTATWIDEQRNELKKIYDKCKNMGNQEIILEAFSVYLLRILNGLSQMESSKLYGFEAQILGESMKLFCIHYISQVDCALEQGIDIEDKKKIISDIEESISKISNVYKNVIDSTSNSDRQMFTNQAVETSIYDISPKLFATYSVILETLVHLFNKQDVYAFLLHPSLKSNIETTSLFDLREKEGKVVLIYIPENEIEKISQIPTYLLHEAFHVLTKEERNRKDRACRMEIHVHNAIFQRIFKNVDLTFIDEVNADENIKMKLMERWFNIDKRIEELKKLEKNNRKFYSKSIIKQICENWRMWLGNIFITLGDDLCHVFNGITKYKKNPYSQIIQIEWEIQRNLVEILTGNLVAQYADMYMAIYREAYADIACILTTGISPEEYEKAFKNSEIIHNVSQTDIIRILRIYVVSKAIVACDGINYSEEWEEYCRQHDFRELKKSNNPKTLVSETTNSKNSNNRIEILDLDLESFEDILTGCSKKLWRTLGQKNNRFEKFRNIIKQINLIEILNGKINEELRELW